MAQPGGHAHTHAHLHDHAHGHGHGAHSHGSAGHPPQPAPWSLLRIPLTVRLGTAIALSAALWAVVLLAMR
jgi:hypothetical protein